MSRRNKRISTISLSCLCVALSCSNSCAARNIPKQRLRGEADTQIGSATNRRQLKKSKKSKSKSTERRSDPVPSERMIVRCKPHMSDENCLEEMSTAGEVFNVIHQLPSLHSFAIEGDLSTVEDFRLMGMDVLPDYERSTLVLEDSMQQYHRSLDQEIPYAIDLIRASNVWTEHNVTGRGVKICVLDTGVDPDHPDLHDLSGYSGAEFEFPWNDDSRGHGTHVTGIIAASDNDEGVVGVAPGAEVFMVHVMRNNGKTYSSDILAALDLCKSANVDIINMSLGGTGSAEAEQTAFQQLYDDGILTIAASGNSGGSDTIYPAAYDTVFSVAASDQGDGIAAFSTMNSFTNIAAPGISIRSTFKNGGYRSASGTSMAAPHVTGVAALLLQLQPSLFPQDLTNAMLSSASTSTHPTGLGIVDALAAVELVIGGLPATSESTCVQADLVIQTDEFGFETGYRLQNLTDRKRVWFGVNLRSHRGYLERSCLDPAKCYRFDIRDTYGDGILAPGLLELRYDGELLLSSGDFGDTDYAEFGNC